MTLATEVNGAVSLGSSVAGVVESFNGAMAVRSLSQGFCPLWCSSSVCVSSFTAGTP